MRDKTNVKSAEFDHYAADYETLHRTSLQAFGSEQDFFAEYKIEDVASEVDARRARVHDILDFGSGCGNSVMPFRRMFPHARLTCADVSTESLRVAQTNFPGSATFLPFDGKRLNLVDGSMDLAFSACVFHHIDHSDHAAQLAELHRVLRDDGLIVIFEHNPLNPLTVAIVNRCPFDADAKLIGASQLKRQMHAAGFEDVSIRYRIFFPTALRRLRFLERSLRWLPLGGQYYAIGRKRV